MNTDRNSRIDLSLSLARLAACLCASTTYFGRTWLGLIRQLDSTPVSSSGKALVVLLAVASVILVGSAGAEPPKSGYIHQAARDGAGGPRSSTIQATVEIGEEQPLTVTVSSELSFGQVRPGLTDGTVVVTTSNTRYATGGVGLRGPQFSRAEFLIAGEPDAFYTIEIGLLVAVHDMRPDAIPGVTALEVVDLLSYSTTVGTETTVGKINQNGVDSVFVGGTLVVPTTALNGRYHGSVELTVNY